jgi:hypothetical protein
MKGIELIIESVSENCIGKIVEIAKVTDLILIDIKEH